MNTKKKGAILELITTMLELSLLEFPGSKVTPNKKIVDLDGIEREIDVFVEKVEDKSVKKYAIECKNFGPRCFVKMEHIEAFFGKLSRLPKDIKGVYLTTGQYQKNAIRKARKFKIQTYKINLTNTPHPNLKQSINKKYDINNYAAILNSGGILRSNEFNTLLFNGKEISIQTFVDSHIKSRFEEVAVKDKLYEHLFERNENGLIFKFNDNEVHTRDVECHVKNILLTAKKTQHKVKAFLFKVDYWIEVETELDPFTSEYVDLKDGNLFAKFFTLISDVNNKLNLIAIIKIPNSNKAKMVIINDNKEKMVADIDNIKMTKK